MNTFNRVALVLLLLLAMVLCSLTLIVPLRALQTIGQQVDVLADLLGRVRPAMRLLLGIFLALVIDLIGILFIVLEVRQPQLKTINVDQAARGEVTLSVASIADQLKAEIKQLPEVMQVKPKVSARRRSVVVEVDVKMAAEAGVPDKAERIVETIRGVMEQKMGLKLARPPKVNIEAVRRPPETRRVSEAPAPAPATGAESPSQPDWEGEPS
jgi:hypothetical protein